MRKRLPVLLGLAVVVGLIALAVSRNSANITNPQDNSETQTSINPADLEPQTIEYPVETGKQSDPFLYPEGYKLQTDPVPAFISVKDSHLTALATKENLGEHNLVFTKEGSADKTLHIVVKPPTVDLAALKAEIVSYIGAKSADFGVWIYDIGRQETVEINADAVFKPASISKLPSVMLALRNTENGTWNLDSTMLALRADMIHNKAAGLGVYGAGAQLPLRRFVESAISISDNTAHYHLHHYLGGLGEVNTRSNTELGIANFYLDPHTATSAEIGKVLLRLYKGEILNAENTAYLLKLMRTTSADLRQGVPAGVNAVTPGLTIANKVGFLFGGPDSAYSDAAIVTGQKTDYILVILTQKAPAFPQGRIALQEIAKLVETKLDK